MTLNARFNLAPCDFRTTVSLLKGKINDDNDDA